MFSTKILGKDDSRSFAVIINKKTNKVEETIYYTELTRELEDVENNFSSEISKYCTSVNDEEHEYRIDSKLYAIEMACNNKRTEKFPRFVKLYIAPSNSGKSYNLSKLSGRYHQVFPNDKIIYASVKDIENDKSYKDTKQFIKQLDLKKQESILDVTGDPDLKSTFFIFDDLDSNAGVFTFQDLDSSMTNEKFNSLTLKEKGVMIRALKNKTTNTIALVNESVKNIICNGRGTEISLCYVYHAFNNGRNENVIINEASSVVLFPYNSTASVMKNWLIKKLNFQKNDALYIVNRKWYQYDFCEINICSGNKFLITNDVIKMFAKKLEN